LFSFIFLELVLINFKNVMANVTPKMIITKITIEGNSSTGVGVGSNGVAEGIGIGALGLGTA
jgi:hypothetical protein